MKETDITICLFAFFHSRKLLHIIMYAEIADCIMMWFVGTQWCVHVCTLNSRMCMLGNGIPNLMNYS